nr:hypothetical protein [Tissierella sp.]
MKKNVEKLSQDSKEAVSEDLKIHLSKLKGASDNVKEAWKDAKENK